MESSSSRIAQERQKQAELRRKIALLQSQLVDIPEAPTSVVPKSPKRKRREDAVLVPPTPSPKKRKTGHRPGGPSGRSPSRSGRERIDTSRSASTPTTKPRIEPIYFRPAPSTILNKLANVARPAVNDTSQPDSIPRTLAFTERPQPPPRETNTGVSTISDGVKRDERLALVEDIEVGPADHKPSFDDPLFEKLEPNSGIRLSSRIVPHDDIQEYLRGRYYLSPSRLYSAIRLLPDKQGYDVPVEGDWVTIAVVAERGPVKSSRAPITVGTEDDGNGVEKAEDWKKKGKQKEEHKPSGKKYMNLKLIDFGARSRSASSATGGKAVIRGDAFLSLLLFESDRFELETREGDLRPKKVYKGGSKGAFESLSRLKEGDVIALLNPKILKPFQRSADSPHPTTNILAVTPESAASIMVIGRALDLGMCTVQKRDGKPCGSWCDTRVSAVCEWHIQNAVQRRRAGRAEFSIGTSGMSNSSAPKRKAAYDPARQWGLKPADDSGGGGATYVVSGHIVSGSGADPRSLHITETMGREGQAKAKRKLNGKDADKALKALLERDKEGMKAVMKAREAGRVMEQKDEKIKNKAKGAGKSANKGKAKQEDKGKRSVTSEDEEDDSMESLTVGKTYSAEVIKQLGFDPTAKGGPRRGDDAIQKKLDALAAVQSSRKDIALGPRPGPKIRSGVVAPIVKRQLLTDTVNLRDLDDSDDDLPERILDDKPPEKLVDLDE